MQDLERAQLPDNSRCCSWTVSVFATFFALSSLLLDEHDTVAGVSEKDASIFREIIVFSIVKNMKTLVVSREFFCECYAGLILVSLGASGEVRLRGGAQQPRGRGGGEEFVD